MKRKPITSKRIVSLLLALAMAAAIIPSTAISAFAATTVSDLYFGLDIKSGELKQEEGSELTNFNYSIKADATAYQFETDSELNQKVLCGPESGNLYISGMGLGSFDCRITVEAYVKIPSKTESGADLTAYDVFQFGDQNLNLAYSSRTYFGAGRYTKGDADIVADKALPTDEWIHVLCTAKEGEQVLYVNGEEFVRGSYTGLTLTSGEDESLVLGGYYGRSGLVKYAYLRVYSNFVEDAQEAEDMYAAMKNNFVSADYTAVDAAIAKIPSDLTPYNEASINTLNAAVDAVSWDKSVNEQAVVDAYAAAIEEAVNALKQKLSAYFEIDIKSGELKNAENTLTLSEYILNEGFTFAEDDILNQKVLCGPESGNLLVDDLNLSALDNQYTIETYVKIPSTLSAYDIFQFDGQNINLVGKSGETYFGAGKFDGAGDANVYIKQALPTDEWIHVVCTAQEGEQVLYVNGEAFASGAYSNLNISYSNSDELLFGSSTEGRSGLIKYAYFRIYSDYANAELAAGLYQEMCADYTAVDAAIAEIPSDLSVYSTDSVSALEDASNAVIRGKLASEQAVVDAYAAAIACAVENLEKKSDANGDGGLYLTELYPNDIDRKAVYGNSDDHMEYVELTNTSGSDISFNNEYELYYEYPSGSDYLLKQLNVNTVDGGTEVTIGAGECVVLWDRRDDVATHATEAQFRTSWLIPDDVKVFVVSNQAGFAADDRGFAIKKQSTGDIVSHYRYYTDVDTSDGLAVHLAIQDHGSEMSACLQNSFGSPGTVFSEQLNQDTAAPEDLTPDGLYLTEIRPNDVDRSAVYGTSDDYMECAELYNSTDSDIEFNQDYQFAYLYKASYFVQPVTTLANVTSGDTSGVIIPAHGSAVIWCYRAASLSGYTSFPDEDDFREAYSIPEGVPVYVQTGQNGWGNTDRGLAILKKNADSNPTNVSYYFWNGVNDVVDNKSLELKVPILGSKMALYKAQSTTNMGVVAEEQYSFYYDDGSSPALELLDQSDTINQGDLLRIPYCFAGSSTLPVTSIEFYYKTNDQDTYTLKSSTSFPIYNKFYAFIDNAELLEADYVEYYLKANNAYRSTTTDLRRIDIVRDDDCSSLRVDFDGAEAADAAVLSGTVDVSAKNYADIGADVTFQLDGSDIAGSPALERYAYFAFEYTGVDSYFKNGLTSGEQVISVFAKCSEVPGSDSLAIPVSQSLFTYQDDGSAEIELTMRAGTYGSTWEADTAANNDDFYAGSFKLHLTDGTILSPVTTVNMSGADIDPSEMIKMGDGSDCTIYVAMTFKIPADKVDAAAFVMDTTNLSDGSHTLRVASGESQKEISFTVDNSVPEESEEQVIDVNVNMSIDENATASVSTGSDVKTVTVYKAESIDGVSTKEGSGDSTASAVSKTDSGATVSGNGEYPYQILEIPVSDESIDALRIEAEAEVNYSQPVQLYVLNTEKNTWDLIDNTTEKDGTVTGVCTLEGHVANGAVTVLVQARGTEYTPYTQADLFNSTQNENTWDGTAVPAQYDFSLAWITDTQYYSEQYMSNFESMTDWIVDQKEELGIEYVVHTGDIVDEFNEEYEFVNASSQLAKFEDAGLPYGVLAGNHDVAHGNMRYDLYWKYFGADIFADSQVYGGSYNNNLGHYDLITVDGEELLFIYMSWDIYYPETDWINEVLTKYPERKAVICMHGGINAKGVQTYPSDFILENVCKDHENVFAVINGHFHGSSLNFVGFDDNNDGTDDRIVYQICTDYQSAPGGGEGYVKMIYFDLANERIYLNSYSPVMVDYNYYDAAKLGSYGIGTLAYDIDIAELSVDFDRDTEKTLAVSSVSVSGLTSVELGSAQCSDTTCSVNLNANAGETLRAYAVLKDSDGTILGYSDTVSFTAGGSHVPVLTAGDADRTSDSAASVTFTSDEAGSYYYIVVDDGAEVPTIDTSGSGTTCGTSEQTIALADLSTGAKDIYIVVKDSDGNVSQMLKLDLAGFAEALTLSLGTERAGGAGYQRTIHIDGSEEALSGKYIAVQFTEGTGTSAKVSVVMISVESSDITISYQKSGTSIDAWLVSGMPNLTGGNMEVEVYDHTST